MPFTPEQIAQREARIKRDEVKAEEEQRQDAQQERLKVELQNRLKNDYPAVPALHREGLHNTAVALTNELLSQFITGAKVLRASEIEWEARFWDYSGDRSTQYLEILQKEARSYNDIGQVFYLKRLTFEEQRRQRGRDSSIYIVCTAPLPQ